MSWQVSGRSIELCNCKAFCPCWLGPEGQPDQGNCSALFAFDVEKGASNGVDLGGTRVVFMARWPGNFFGGDGSGRLYIDATTSGDQRRELESIFSGRSGGLFEGLWGAVLSHWHPARSIAVEIEWGDKPRIEVQGIGKAMLAPFVDGAGQATTVTGAAAQGAFQIESMTLASARDSDWRDPDLGTWKGDSGTLHRFNWTA